MGNKPYIFKCSSCGSSKVFSPKDQALLCRHCESVTAFDIDNNIIKKPFFENADKSRQTLEKDDSLEILKCSSCGAELNLLAGEISGNCPFCGTGNINPLENISGLKPDECIPFTIEAKDAEDSFNKWIKKRWFAPSDLKKKARADHLKGVYSPCYAFDTNSQSTYSGVLGKSYTTYVGSGKNRRMVVKIRYFNISGSLNKDFVDVMTECSPHIDQKALDKIRPFKMEKRAVFNKAFLSGYSADSNDIDLYQGWNITKQKMDGEIKRAILSKYQYDVVQSLTIKTNYSDINYSYMLLPIYLSGYKYKEKFYNFLVNGTTGKTYGKFPLSPIKIFFAILAAAALMVAAYFVLGYYGYI